jgi:transketolase
MEGGVLFKMNYNFLEEKVLDIKIRGLDFSRENPGVRHFGGAFSQAHILTALYKEVMNKDDLFILSKGHTCATWYPLLQDNGYNPRILGHPQKDVNNGILMTMGSLGRGYNFASGLSFAKNFNNEQGRVYVLIGDGECQEGTFWEFLISQGRKFKPNNLIAIVDKNNIQGSVNEIIPMEGLPSIAKTLDWYTDEVDGHNFDKLIPALRTGIEGKPTFIIANTIKGKGVSFMENNPIWHSKAPTEKEYNLARNELTNKLKLIK